MQHKNAAQMVCMNLHLEISVKYVINWILHKSSLPQVRGAGV